MRRMFETRSHAWREAGLARELTAARRARGPSATRCCFILLFAGVLVAYSYRDDLFGPLDKPVRIGTVIALLRPGLGVRARRRAAPLGAGALPAPGPGDRGHGRASSSGCRDPAGRVARRAAHRRAWTPRDARRRRRLHRRRRRSGGPADARQPDRRAWSCSAPGRSGSASACACRAAALAGRSRASSARWACSTRRSRTARTGSWSPTASCSNAAVVPLREPDAVDLRARLRAGRAPLRRPDAPRATTSPWPCAGHPHIALEEFDGDEVVVRISATPQEPPSGPQLADEILVAIGRRRRARATAPTAAAAAVAEQRRRQLTAG